MTPLVLGKREIAKLLGVAPTTPSQWQTRKQLPAPDHPPVNGSPAWTVELIEEWAREHGKGRP